MKQLKEFLHRRPSAWFMLYIPVYVLAFFAVERLVPTTGYWVSYIPWDDLIPFCEYFVVFYCMWYPLLIGTALYLFLRDDRSFRLYAWFLIVAFTGTLLFCLLFPNGQDLRPAEFSRHNLFTWVVQQIYRADTNTNVIPSMHVLGCMGACFGLFRCRTTPRWAKIGVVALTLLINCSTVFIKQHSLLDVFIALAVSIVLYFAVFVWLDRYSKPTPLPAAEPARETELADA